jgi:hypothetical protein
MAMTFWSFYWGDSEWRQRQDIDSAFATEASDMAFVTAQIRQLKTEIADLQHTVAALMKVLAEMGQLDPRAVQLRVEAELEAMKPPPAPPRAPDAYPHKAKPVDTPVQCARCGDRVPSSRTTITEQGTLCDRCAGV